MEGDTLSNLPFGLPLDIWFEICRRDPQACNRIVRLNKTYLSLFKCALPFNIPIGTREIFSYLRSSGFQMRFTRLFPPTYLPMALLPGPPGPDFVRVANELHDEELNEKYRRVLYKTTYPAWLEKIEKDGFLLSLTDTYRILQKRKLLMERDPGYSLEVTFNLFRSRMASLRENLEYPLRLEPTLQLLAQDIIEIFPKEVQTTLRRLYEKKKGFGSYDTVTQRSLTAYLSLIPHLEEVVAKTLNGLRNPSNSLTTSNGQHSLPQPAGSTDGGGPGTI